MLAFPTMSLEAQNEKYSQLGLTLKQITGNATAVFFGTPEFLVPISLELSNISEETFSIISALDGSLIRNDEENITFYLCASSAT